MKKFTSLFFVLTLILTGHLSGKEAAQTAAPIGTEQSLNLDDGDGYLLLDCQLRPIKRKSKSNKEKVSHPHHVGLADKHSARATTLNWSGYVAVTKKKNHLSPKYNSVTEVLGTWIVPEVSASARGDTYSSAWVGIDGFANSVVEQIGTEHDVINGQPVYFAWFEMFPADSQLIEGFPVEKGDKIEGIVTYKGLDHSGNNCFRLIIKNHTRRVKFGVLQSTLAGYPAHLSSADWIVEAPAISISDKCIGILPLANFGAISFKNCQASINGRKGAIENRHWSNVAISMATNNGALKDITSDLFSHCKDSSSKKKSKCKKDAFRVIWKKSGPFPFESVCSS